MKTHNLSFKRNRLMSLFWVFILLLSLPLVGKSFSTSNPYLATEMTGISQEGSYVGPEICMQCHQDQFDK